MQRINQAQLSNVLAAPAASLSRSLSTEDLSILLAEMVILIRCYPSQDQEESIEVYQQGFEALALKYSIQMVKDALRALQIKSTQQFFPRPSEVAAEIETALERSRSANAARSQATRREKEIAEFWVFAPQWMTDTGNDETELLRRFPSYKGTKPACTSKERTRANVVSMAPRSGKSGEVNGDEAA